MGGEDPPAGPRGPADEPLGLELVEPIEGDLFPPTDDGPDLGQGYHFGETIHGAPYVHAIYQVIREDGSCRLERGAAVYADRNPDLWDRLRAIRALIGPIATACGEADERR